MFSLAYLTPEFGIKSSAESSFLLGVSTVSVQSAEPVSVVHPVDFVQSSEAWRWEAWELRDSASSYNMLWESAIWDSTICIQVGKYIVQYALNLDSSKKVTTSRSSHDHRLLPQGGITVQHKCV